VEDERPSAEISGLPEALSELPWSAEFVMQAIEILPIALRDGRLVTHGPLHAESFVVGWPAGAKPEQVASDALVRLALRAVVLHSTSWRYAGDEVVLTYLAVVEPDASPPESWTTQAVRRAELARGGATGPPAAIGVLQVLEHALRHLTWLMRDDSAIASALPGWSRALADYVPEPFRAFGSPVTGA
jgi:hypothetical protein